MQEPIENLVMNLNEYRTQTANTTCLMNGRRKKINHDVMSEKRIGGEYSSRRAQTA